MERSWPNQSGLSCGLAVCELGPKLALAELMLPLRTEERRYQNDVWFLLGILFRVSGLAVHQPPPRPGAWWLKRPTGHPGGSSGPQAVLAERKGENGPQASGQGTHEVVFDRRPLVCVAQAEIRGD